MRAGTLEFFPNQLYEVREVRDAPNGSFIPNRLEQGTYRVRGRTVTFTPQFRDREPFSLSPGRVEGRHLFVTLGESGRCMDQPYEALYLQIAP